MFSGTTQVSHQVCQLFSSSVCLLVCVTVVDNNKAVVCYLLATSVIKLSEKKKRKRKMCSKKWYLKRNVSCDVHLFYSLWKVECLDVMQSKLPSLLSFSVIHILRNTVKSFSLPLTLRN
jgi:hypothetical protein